MSESTALTKLQEIDLELLRDAKTLSQMPQQEKIRTIKLAQKKVSSELTRIVGQRKDAETDLSDLKANLAHYLDVKEQVQAEVDEGSHTHRELRAYEESLTSLAKRIEKCEFDRPGLESALERLQKAEKNANLTVEKLEAELKSQQESFDSETSELKSHVLDLKAQRDAAASEVAPEHLETYEAARKRFGGLAVEVLNGNVPSICRVKLQPSLFHDLSHGPEITECPYCHRMLITGNEVEE